MAPSPLSWLFRLTALCHLTMLLAGQHPGVKKCNVICDKMTSEIPRELLIGYQRNQDSCGKRAIILETRKHKFLCADPAEDWVQRAMERLDRQAAALTPNGGTFEKQIGVGEPGTTLAARGTDRSTATEPKGPGEDSGQEGQRALVTSPELPTGATASWETRPPSAAQGPDGGTFTGPARTQLSSTAALTTAAAATAWHSSAASQPALGVWAEGKAFAGPLTQVAPSQAPTTPAPSTPAPPTQATPTQTLPTQTLPTQTPSPQTTPTQTPSPQPTPTQTPSPQPTPTQTPSPQPTPTQTPSPQVTPTQTPSPKLPTTAHTAPEDIFGPTGQTAGAQDPLLEGSLGPQEVGPVSAHPDVFMGPGSIPHVSAVPMSSEWDPSREPVASGSWAPKAEEPIHATVDPQRLGVLMTPVPDSQVATRRQAVGLLAFLGLLFCVGVAMFAYQSLQGCPRKVAGDMVEGLRYMPRSCGSNSYVLVPV